MSINTTGQWADTNYTRFSLANGVQVRLGSESKSHEMIFSVYDMNGSQISNITEEITGANGSEAVTTSADRLLYWLSLAKDWRPKNEQSCEKRIHKHLESQLADMRKLGNLQQIDEDEWEEDANLRLQLWNENWGDEPDDYQDAIEIAEDRERESFAISVQKKTVYDVQCSWGGPSDGFLVEVDEGEIVGITYYFKDWYDGARLELSGDAFDTAQGYIEQMVYLGD